MTSSLAPFDLVPNVRAVRAGGGEGGVALAVGLLLLLAAPPVTAAPLVGADPVGVCAGLVPCFTTLQEAVDNAGPGAAEVRVFPGTYAESVDLQTMGSAVSGGPDDLVLIAVDASGAPDPGAALVDPAAGPGSGAAISTGLGGPFPGDLVVDGLEVRSPDSSALILASDGAVAVRRVLAQFAAEAGVLVALGTTVEVIDTVARLNGGSGINAFASGAATVVSSVAERNDGNGFGIAGDTVTVTGSVATANGGDGFVIVPTGSCVIAESQSIGNTVGYSILDLGAPPPPPLLALGNAGRAFERARHRAAADLWAGSPVPPAVRGSAPAHAAGLHVEVSGSEAIDNLEDGLLAAGEVVEVELFTATGNGLTGVTLVADEVLLSGSVLLANRTGALLGGGAVTVTSSEASDSTPFDGSPIPLSGSGFFVLAEQATITLARARRNESAGFLLAGGTTPSNFAVVDSLAEEGLFGVLIQSLDEAAMTVAIDGLISRRNGGGASFGGADAVTLHDSEIVENTVGINGVVEGLLAIESSDLRENSGGGLTLSLEPGSQASIRCSNLSGNTAHGARLETPGALDARRNFWGQASGPMHPANPGGTGDRAIDAAAGGVGTIDFAGFLAQQATAADCAFAVVEIPALGPAGGVLLALALAGVGVLVLARRRGPQPAGR